MATETNIITIIQIVVDGDKQVTTARDANDVWALIESSVEDTLLVCCLTGKIYAPNVDRPQTWEDEIAVRIAGAAWAYVQEREAL